MKYFSREEMACKCGCKFNTVDYELAMVLDTLREFFNTPVTITSGCRCVDHNKAVGGSPNSKHLLGIAADIKVKGVSPKEVYEYLDTKYTTKYGIGLYSSWVHIDVRKHRARW